MCGQPWEIFHVQVDFNAKDEYTSINNYKVLQSGFNKLSIDKVRHVSLLTYKEEEFPCFPLQKGSCQILSLASHMTVCCPDIDICSLL